MTYASKALLVAAAAVAFDVASWAAAAPQGNAGRGAEVYARCAGCHSLTQDRTGPRHCGLFGRESGSVAGFAYSPAMRRARLRWDTATLDRFLADPARTVPGTTMTYAGVADAQERADVIAYLREAGDGACTGVRAAARSALLSLVPIEGQL